MPDPTEAPPRFEQALAELDSILRELEDGTTSSKTRSPATSAASACSGTATPNSATPSRG